MQSRIAFPRIIAISLTAMLALSAFGTNAEDGTSGTLPESFHECEVVEANWTAPAESPEASPVASPVASPMATPVTVGIDPLTEDLMHSTNAILDCMSDNDVEILTEITGEQFRASWLGIGSTVNDDDFAALLPMMPNLPYELVYIENATADDDSATATVTFTKGRQLLTREWSYQLVEIDGTTTWQVQQEERLPTEVPADASTMQLTVEDGSYSFAEPTVAAGDIVIEIENRGENAHEVLIVRVPGEASAADFAAAPSGIPNGGTFIGQVTIPAGSEGNIVLTDVRAATYTVVDLLPDATGIPNVSNGMITEFTVE